MEGSALNKAASFVEEGLKKYQVIESILTGESISAEETESLREFDCVKQFLDLPLDDPREGDLKKVFAGAISTASEMGILPFDLPKDSAVDIASAVDEGLQFAKIGYQLATGGINIENIADIAIDHAAARALTVADMYIDHGATVVAGAISSFVTSVCPPAAVLTPIIHVATNRVASGVKTIIHKAAPTIVSATKSVVHAGISVASSMAKSAVKSVASFGSRALSSVGSFFSSIF